MSKLIFDYLISAYYCPVCGHHFENASDHTEPCPKSEKIFLLRRAMILKLEMLIAQKLAERKAHPEYISGVINSLPYDADDVDDFPTWRLENLIAVWRKRPPRKIIEGIGKPRTPSHNSND